MATPFASADRRSFLTESTATALPSQRTDKVRSGAKGGRLLSIDLLRGLTIGFMILVNDNGDEQHAYWALKHAYWNGFTPTDLVFPTFLFLVGISTVLSMETRLARGAERALLFRHVVQRSITLYLLGLLVNSFPLFHLATMRFYGVLPRIAVCYLVVASLYLLSPGWRSKLLLFVGALGGYWLLMRFVPVPGYGVPTHGVPLLDRDGNLTAWLDRQIFSAPHLYEHTRDPEGLLSTLPALGTTLLGLLTGIWLRTARSIGAKARGIAVAGVSCLLLGGLWNTTFPINKKLWTSSYVLFAGGCSLVLLALALWIADVSRPDAGDEPTRPWYATPLLVFGMNAISAYVLSELLAAALGTIRMSSGLSAQQAIYRVFAHAIPDQVFASLVYSLAYVLVCWIPMAVLYRRRIFLKV